MSVTVEATYQDGAFKPVQLVLLPGGTTGIAKPSPECVWITFHKAKLWWTRLAGPVEQDDVSKFQRSTVPWSDKTVR